MVNGAGVLILLIVLLAVALLVIAFLIVKYFEWQSRVNDLTHQHAQLLANMNDHARIQFESWRDRELQSIRVQLWQAAQSEAQNTMMRWQMETEANIRADAIARSSAVVRGKVTEHLTPYMGMFPYNPKDVRFLGSPVD